MGHSCPLEKGTSFSVVRTGGMMKKSNSLSEHGG